MSTMSVSEARAALTTVIDRVQAGEEVTLTRHGRDVAVLVRPDVLRVRRGERSLAEAERLRDLLEHGRRTRLADAPAVAAKRAEELAADVAANRSAR